MKTAYISFSALITDKSVQALINTITEQLSKRVEHLYFLFSSDGGSTTPGFHLIQFIRGLPVETTMHNLSHCASMGPAILLSAKNRIAVPEASFMFHDPSAYNYGRMDLRDTKEHEAYLRQVVDQYVALLVRETKLTKAEANAVLYGPNRFDNKWALDKGVIDAVQDFQLPLGATIVQPNF